MDDPKPRRSIILSILAALLALTGLWLAVGGGWLVLLGGTVYYLLAGIVLIVTAYLLWRRRGLALALYAALILGTILWAIAEVGLDFWALAPRGDVLVPLGIVLALPWVVRRLGAARWPGPAWPLLASLVIAAIVLCSALLREPHDLAGTLPGPRPTAASGILAGVPEQDWTAYGRSSRGDRWSPLRQITPHNAASLQKAWEFHTGDLQRPTDPDEFTYEVTPIKVGGLLYLCSPHNIVFALDAETGREVWRYNPNIRASKDMQHLTCRGVSYHSASLPGAERAADGDCPDRIIMG